MPDVYNDVITLNFEIQNKNALHSLEEVKQAAANTGEEIQKMRNEIDTEMPGYKENVEFAYSNLQSNLEM